MRTKRFVLHPGRFVRGHAARHGQAGESQQKFVEALMRAKNPALQALEAGLEIAKLDPVLFRSMFEERFQNPASAVFLHTWEVPAIGATHSEVYFYPTVAYLEFLVAFRTLKGV